ncbi:hypothetical protein Avbf_17830 [Armadillidium vulgare]|nr:hypothetical protein Avbf_17830 [Armadillidium vulgare]
MNVVQSLIPCICKDIWNLRLQLDSRCSRRSRQQLIGNFRQGPPTRTINIVLKKETSRLFRDPDDDVQYSGSYLSRKRSFDESVTKLRFQIHKRSVYDKIVSEDLRKWQFDILSVLFVQNDRKIMWIYDEKGGRGKIYSAARGAVMSVLY